MTISPPPFEFITQPALLDAAARAMAREPAIGLDTAGPERIHDISHRQTGLNCIG